MSSMIRQLKHVERVADIGMVDLRAQELRHGKKSARARRDRDVLLSADAVGDRIALDSGAEAYLPQHFSRLDIERFEVAVIIADECKATGSGQHEGQERGALLMAPHLFHRPQVDRDELSKVPVATRHLNESEFGSRSTRSSDLRGLDPRHLEAALTHRDDE